MSGSLEPFMHAAANYAVGVSQDLAGGVIAGVFGIAMLSLYNRMRSDSALKHGRFRDDEGTLGRTFYRPTGVLNAATETKNEMYEQDIIALDRLQLETIFPNATKRMVHTLQKAAKFCTPDAPIVWQHLDRVIKKPDELETFKRLLQKEWRGYFSSILNEGSGIDTMHVKGREHPEFDIMIPILVSEKTDNKHQLRFLLYTLEELQPGFYPEPEDVTIGGFCTPGHADMDRLHTNRTVARILDVTAKEPHWIYDMVATRVATGKILTMPPVHSDAPRRRRRPAAACKPG